MTENEAIEFMQRYLDADCYTDKCVNAHDMAINHHFDDDKDNYDLLIHNLCKDIRQIPTAYDVDKVLQQLEKEQEKLETDIFARESDNWYGQYCNGINEGIEKAIEIVKGGGVDAKTDS